MLSKKPYSLSVLFGRFFSDSVTFSFFRREYLETECHIYSCVLPLKMVYSILSILSQFAERLSSDSIIYYFYLLLSYRLFSFHLIDSFQWLLYHVITISYEASRRDKNGSLQFWTILWISCQNETHTSQYLSGCSPGIFCDIHEQSKRSKSELFSTS